jgi:hypothetical protein
MELLKVDRLADVAVAAENIAVDQILFFLGRITTGRSRVTLLARTCSSTSRPSTLGNLKSSSITAGKSGGLRPA